MSNIAVFSTGYGFNFDTEAKKLGATHRRLFYVTTGYGYYGKQQNLFSTHYFNCNDEEVAYYIEDLKRICGMVVFERPRVWSEEFKVLPDYTLVKYID